MGDVKVDRDWLVHVDSITSLVAYRGKAGLDDEMVDDLKNVSAKARALAAEEAPERPKVAEFDVGDVKAAVASAGLAFSMAPPNADEVDQVIEPVLRLARRLDELGGPENTGAFVKIVTGMVALGQALKRT